jgi:tetraacyldisaccharide-1-P 4'-kinase
VFFQLFAKVKNHFTAEIFRIFRIAAVPGDEFLEIVGVTGIVAPEGFRDKLVADRKIVSELLMADHQAIKNNTSIRFHRKPQVWRMVDVFIVFITHFFISPIQS